jgi:DNA polymerase I
MKKLVVLDSHSVLFKSHFAFMKNPLRNSKGMVTSALFGFLRTFFSLLEEFEPDYLCFAFDKSRNTFRRELYPEYKAHRSATPEELVQQFPYARKLAEALGIQTLMLDRFEADDILGSVSHQFTKSHEDLEVYLITGDRDSFQLVRERVYVGYTSSRLKNGIEIYDETKIKETYDLNPERLVQVKALQGDSSDNIPGVRGIGEKTALKLIREHHSLEGLYEKIDSFKGRLKEKLVEGQDLAFLCEKLARIKTDIELPFSLEKLAWKESYSPEFLELLEELEFTSMIESLYPQSSTSKSKPKQIVEKNYQLVSNHNVLKDLLQELNTSDVIAFDTETSSLDGYRTQLVGISFSTRPHTGFYIPLGHRYLGVPSQLPMTEVLEPLAKLFSNPKKTWIAHNLKFDMSVLQRQAIPFPALYCDTMILAHLLHPTGRMGLKQLAIEHLGEDPKEFQELVDKGGSFSSVAVEKASIYACADADHCLRLYEIFSTELEKYPKLKELANSLEMPLIPVLENMESNGFHINAKVFDRLSIELEAELRNLQAEIFKIAGCEFNLNSPKQLSKVLLENLKIPLKKKTKTGFSTATDVLEELAPHYPICRIVTEYRHLSKLLNTYVLPIPKMATDKGLIRTSFNQTVVATGRLSSTHPNLQNIPVRTEWGRKIREGFIPRDPSWSLVAIDYSQIELRVLAQVSKDTGLREAFLGDRDIHAETASKIFSKSLEDISYQERDSAKAINFGIIYGISAFGLSRQLKIPVPSAQSFINSYFSHYPGIQGFMEKTAEEGKEAGEIQTLFGRIRRIDELRSSNKSTQEAGKRIAINSRIQGTAAELIKMAMLRLYNYLETKNLQTRILIQVHDEMIFEVPPDELHEVKNLKNVMESVVDFEIPLTCDVEAGPNWGSLEPFDA